MYVEIDVGMGKYASFNSGSSADTTSHNSTQDSNTRTHTLDRSAPSKLGTVGSRAFIDHGTWTLVELGDRKEDGYCPDVVEIDRYDVSVGASFVSKFGVRPELSPTALVVGDTVIGVHPSGEVAPLKNWEIRTRVGTGETGLERACMRGKIPCDFQNSVNSPEGGTNPFLSRSVSSANSADGTVEVFRLHLRGQVLVDRTSEIENLRFRNLRLSNVGSIWI